MVITIKANFNKQTKDSKKELVQFYVKGEDERKPQLDEMCREVVELEIEGVEACLTTEFVKKTKDSKKTILEFIVKGDTSADQSYEFYRKAGSDVTLIIAESQMTIEEFRGEDDGGEKQDPPRQGIPYTANPDGTVDVNDKDQLEMEELDGPPMPGDNDLPF